MMCDPAEAEEGIVTVAEKFPFFCVVVLIRV